MNRRVNIGKYYIATKFYCVLHENRNNNTDIFIQIFFYSPERHSQNLFDAYFHLSYKQSDQNFLLHNRRNV